MGMVYESNRLDINNLKIYGKIGTLLYSGTFTSPSSMTTATVINLEAPITNFYILAIRSTIPSASYFGSENITIPVGELLSGYKFCGMFIAIQGIENSYETVNYYTQQKSTEVTVRIKGY